MSDDNDRTGLMYVPFWEQLEPEQRDQVRVYDNQELDNFIYEARHDLMMASKLTAHGITTFEDENGELQTVAQGVEQAQIMLLLATEELNIRVRLN